MRILIVEDQRDMSAMMADRIERAGFVADRVCTLRDALEAIRTYDYPIVLLDRRLPDGDAVGALPDIRRFQPSIRILVVSALRALDDKIEGLDAGADDYLTKPFDADELLARMRASLRRPGAAPLPLIAVGSLSFDPNTREAFVGDRPLTLQRRETLLLETLMRRAERVVGYQTVIEEIYGFEEDVLIDAVRMLASRLRQRLKDENANVELISARGVGYMIRRRR
ncbi:MAG: two-component system response regulator [Methylocystaceae bacterium]|nr:MAG: two-component system response regulator [Methylocystaceae bacterium]